MDSPIEFAPPSLDLAASMIRDYGERNCLTPRQLIDVFYEGLTKFFEVGLLQDGKQAAQIAYGNADTNAVVMELETQRMYCGPACGAMLGTVDRVVALDRGELPKLGDSRSAVVR